MLRHPDNFKKKKDCLARGGERSVFALYKSASWRRETRGRPSRTGKIQTGRGKEESFSGEAATEMSFAF